MTTVPSGEPVALVMPVSAQEAAAPNDPTGSDQRDRILGVALALMAEGGLHGTSMRKLASACGLNVATLYHYFGSKQELFTAAIHHHSIDLLGDDSPPASRSLPVPERLGALLEWLLLETLERGELIWRLLLGESLRGEPVVVETAAALSAAFHEALVSWMGELFDADELDHEAVARLVRSTVYGCIVESLLAREHWEELAAQRAHDLSSLVCSPHLSS